MATKSKAINVDLNSVFEGAASQFRSLNPNEPGQWPMLPKILTWAFVAVIMIVLGWFLLLSSAHDELDTERGKEPTRKADYRNKLGQAVNLAELRKQKLQVEEYVTQLEKQLPGKAEMDALLSDINQAGLGRGLQFELFKPGQVVVKDYYAELPISIKVSGRYHDIGAFAGDIANLSRIVTLHNLDIKAAPRDSSGALGMEATARTYRYLDANEVEEIRKNNAKAKAAAAGGAKK
ncbi:MAG: type 4a pilus biogenesis protein PilO [Burkholderiales bacterium]